MSADLALVRDDAAIDMAADPAAYVVVACERAKVWLSNALEYGDIGQIIELKSRAEAIRIYTQQKELGKDAELSATEIVRRAERGVHLALEKARERGDVLKPGQTVRRPGHHVNGSDTVKTLTDVGLSRTDLGNTAPLAKDVSDEEYEEALNEARAEKDLSRANVVRKVRSKASSRTPLPQRLEQLQSLAEQRFTSRQISRQLGMTAEHVRELARRNGVEIPADRVVGKTKHIDPQRVVRETVYALEGLRQGLNLVSTEDMDEFAPEQVREWLSSLNESLRCLRHLVKELNQRV